MAIKKITWEQKARSVGGEQEMFAFPGPQRRCSACVQRAPTRRGWPLPACPSRRSWTRIKEIRALSRVPAGEIRVSCCAGWLALSLSLLVLLETPGNGIGFSPRCSGRYGMKILTSAGTRVSAGSGTTSRLETGTGRSGLLLSAAGHGYPLCIFSGNHSFLEPPPWGGPERRREEKNSSSVKESECGVKKEQSGTEHSWRCRAFHRGVNILLPGMDLLGWKNKPKGLNQPRQRTRPAPHSTQRFKSFKRGTQPKNNCQLPINIYR